MSSARGQQFSTADRGAETACASSQQTGWWLDTACTQGGNLNAGVSALIWDDEPLQQVEMLVRDIQFQDVASSSLTGPQTTTPQSTTISFQAVTKNGESQFEY